MTSGHLNTLKDISTVGTQQHFLTCPNCYQKKRRNNLLALRGPPPQATIRPKVLHYSYAKRQDLPSCTTTPFALSL